VNVHACCAGVSSGSSRGCAKPGARIASRGPRPLARRCREVAGWIVPGGILALLPKCPACLAAYCAIGGGIGISVSTAIYVRVGLVTLCVASLSYFAVSRGCRFIARPRPAAAQSADACPTLRSFFSAFFPSQEHPSPAHTLCTRIIFTLARSSCHGGTA
jgi:hypothetical protein